MYVNCFVNIGFYLTIIALCAGTANAKSNKFLKNYRNKTVGFLAQDECHALCNLPSSFNCECRKPHARDRAPVCVPLHWNCDGWSDCDDRSDEKECRCANNQTQFSACESASGCTGQVKHDLYRCASTRALNENDREFFKSKQKCLLLYPSDPEYCDPDSVMLKQHKCDGVINYPLHDLNDEADCLSCPFNATNRCKCNKEHRMSCSGHGATCYSDEMFCNKIADCADSSDEIGCKCGEDEFTCKCYEGNPPTCFYDKACIPKSKRGDGRKDCPDGSDEIQQRHITTRSGSCDKTLYRLKNKSKCREIRFPFCDERTCYETPSFDCLHQPCNITDVICTSLCTDDDLIRHPAMQCNDGSLILASQFCNGVKDCPDNSDELRFQPGFKCSRSHDACILPQINLFDDVAQCENNVDLCKEGSCFECFDKRLNVSLRQLCDGIVDCYDFSDECLCETNMFKENCDAIFTKVNADSTTCSYSKLTSELDEHFMATNPKVLQLISPDNYRTKIQGFLNITYRSKRTFCQTKYGLTIPTLCDGKPECSDYSDECSCKKRPNFCDDPCFSFFPIGDRYCDGIEDEAWKFIDDPNCPRGFDEKECPDRFYCRAGSKMSIDDSQICDGIKDCDDGSDEQEWRCAHLFSSDEEMIANPFIRIGYWIIGFLVVFGNFFVIMTTARLIQTSKSSSSLKCQHLIVLNVSIADFIMGIYLLTIASFSAVFSGYYGEVDLAWRSSLSCSLIGSLAIISSEASCFLMLVLAIFRLHNICKPIASLTNPTWVWKFCIFVAWLFATIFGVLPVLPQTSEYFGYSIFFRSPFNLDGTWMKLSLTKFACRYAALSNQTIDDVGTAWESTKKFLKNLFPETLTDKEFGYYGESSVCMPRFYIPRGEKSWEFTFVLITFNFLSFLFIAACYVIMYFYSQRQNQRFKKARTSKTEVNMQKRIARIIATDFCCWVPVCILVYLRMSGITFSTLACQISAVLILPINSAINPILYSSLGEKLFKKISSTKLSGALLRSPRK